MAGRKRKIILIADDEENIRHLVRNMLDKENTVIEAEDGEVAIHMARRHKPDLILMDIFMPKMDGYTACKTIKMDSITQAIPVIMLTAVDYELNVKLSREMAAEGYITKPFSQQNLVDTVARLLKSRE
ncbi:MAG: response regulator [Chloroflexi bacterium]|nr:response regulator [Chloroflexota bacterium]